MKIQLDLLQNNPVTTSVVNINPLSNVDNLEDINALGFKGFHFSGGNKAQNSGCWLDGSFKFYAESEGYPGILGNILSSNIDGSFAVAQDLVINSSSSALLDYVVIKFDKTAGEYATHIKIDNTIYNNYGYVFVAKFTPRESVTISILQWSKKNSIVKINAVTCNIVLDFTEKYIKSVSYENSIIVNDNVASFGILNQTGSLTLKDSGVLKALNDTEMLYTGAGVKIYEDEVLVQQFIAESYSNESTVGNWTIQMTDDLVAWENEQFAGFSYASKTLRQIFDILLPGATYVNADYLSNIIIPNAFMRISTKWDAVVKCCNIGMVRAYKINGQIYVRGML